MSDICFDGCLKEFDTKCIEYTGDPLGNLGISSGATLEEILWELNLIVPVQTVFSASSNNSMKAQGGGTLGHSPIYSVRISSSDDNLMSVSNVGLFVPPGEGGDGKSKVDADDDKDYLEDQFAGDSDGILTISVEKKDGKLKFVPFIDVETLLIIIKASYQDEFCDAIENC